MCAALAHPPINEVEEDRLMIMEKVPQSEKLI
jgi:hypothetical protein